MAVRTSEKLVMSPMAISTPGGRKVLSSRLRTKARTDFPDLSRSRIKCWPKRPRAPVTKTVVSIGGLRVQAARALPVALQPNGLNNRHDLQRSYSRGPASKNSWHGQAPLKPTARPGDSVNIPRTRWLSGVTTAIRPGWPKTGGEGIASRGPATRDPYKVSPSGPEVRFWKRRPSGVLHTEVVVDRVTKLLLAAQVALGRLNRCVAEQELYLLQFPARQVAQTRAGTPQIVRGKILDAGALRSSFHNVPYCL